MPRDRRIPEILLVEDNPGDVELVREGLRSSGVPHELVVRPDGPSALAYLAGEPGEEPARGLPDLVLLDLNLPGLHGKEVLEALQERQVGGFPVVVVSSERTADVPALHELGAVDFVAKPGTAAELRSFVQRLVEHLAPKGAAGLETSASA